MNSLTIYHGTSEPIRVRGVNVCNLVSFAERNKGWHTFKQDRATKRAIESAKRAGCIEVSKDQFRFIYPNN